MESIQFVFQKIGGFFASFSVAPTYVKAGAIIILLFLLVISMAQFRHHFVKGAFKGGFVGIFFGILLTLIIEGFLLLNGNTVLTSMLGWNNAPKPISTALDLGKVKLINILGAKVESETSKDVITIMQSLNPDEIKKVKSIICTPYK